MTSDLQVYKIKLPSPVVGACPTKVQVEVYNVGADPASFPVPMKVCMEIRASLDGQPTSSYEAFTPVETPPLQPSPPPSLGPPVLMTFVFTDVTFPCATSCFVVATVDCNASVPDNDRTSPVLVEPVPKIDAVPWLWTDLRIGLKDSTGFVTWSPGALCPSATLVAEVRLRNAGCAIAPASMTTLELLDGASQSIAVMKSTTPAIPAGTTVVVPFTATLPPAVTGQKVTVRAVADSTGVVIGQCDLTHARAEQVLGLGAPGKPTLTFSALASIFPGDPVPLTWKLQNVCADLGKVTARISFQAVNLFTSTPINIGLQEAGGADLLIDPSLVPASFYKIGKSKLTLEVTGTGTDPGPYAATADVTVLAEPASGTWVFTAPPAPTTGTSPWKRPYTVSGRLTNPARAAMTPSSLVLNETATVQAAVTLQATPPLTAIVMGAFRADVWSFTQTWSWLVPGVWVPTGPFAGTFGYSVTFSMQDEYGNAYPAVTSTGTSVLVSVSTTKTVLAGFAFGFAVTGAGLFIAALAALGYPPVAGALFAAAGVAFTIAAGFGVGALDPPVPNFDYRRVEVVVLPQFPQAVTESAALAPLLAVFALLSRVSTTVAAMSATEARLVAARIDRDRAAIELQTAEYLGLRESLLAASGEVAGAVNDALERMPGEPALAPGLDGRALEQTFDGWRRDGVSAKERRQWRASGLTPEELRIIDLGLATDGFDVRPLDAVLADLSQLAVRLADAVLEESEAVLNPPARPGRPGRDAGTQQ